MTLMSRSYKQLTSKALNIGLSVRSLHTTFTRNAVQSQSSLLVVNESNGVREVLLNNPKKR
ncbi:unnamed protein product [Medioppia subpectinata]|uniref:Uncharacterized protein n=1 Tax=Medioppia subpectinata TaxID=1979941 RepID=A0A7R9L8M3_9ACAR|nr:unnamed protein product [Medioppia subpectinata]CAG2116420.1 unnamed protein product [Medioppia subpectinata]